MKDTPALRLAVTGASGTGKTTVCTALSLATGLNFAAISPHLVVPSRARRLAHTVEAPVRAFEQRVDSESRLPGGFVSDGSVLHEWAMAEALRRTRKLSHWIRNPGDLPYRVFEKRFLAAHADIVSRRGRTTYHGFIHLRLDPNSDDSTSGEPESRDSKAAAADIFRQTTDRLLRDVVHDSAVPYLVVAGTVEEIVTSVAGMFQLPQLMPVTDAVTAALRAA